MEKIFVRFGGYTPATVTQASPEDREPIVKLGMAVAFSALVASVNWGTAGWTFSPNHSDELRFVIAAVAGLFSFGLVAILDSSFLYFADISEAAWFKKMSYGALRVVIILLVSAITSQAVIPVLFRSELEAHALKMAENSESTRVKTLDGQFKVGDKQLAKVSASEEVAQLEEKSKIIPPDIQQRLDSAKQCWSSYSSKKKGLISAGYSGSEIKKMMGPQAGVCSSAAKLAQNKLYAYTEDIRSQLMTARETKNQAVEELHATRDTIAKRISNARAIEDKAFSPSSATVLSSLLEADLGVKIKYYMVTLFLITLECLPLLLKLIAGRSPIGERIAAEKKEARKRRSMVMAEAEHERCITDAMLAASQDACLKVLSSADGRTHFAKVFSCYMMALAPTEGVNKMMREIERQQADVNDFIRRYPRYATVIAEAWTRAIRETTEILVAHPT
jgi:hypothetical protein